MHVNIYANIKLLRCDMLLYNMHHQHLPCIFWAEINTLIDYLPGTPSGLLMGGLRPKVNRNAFSNKSIAFSGLYSPGPRMFYEK